MQAPSPVLPASTRLGNIAWRLSQKHWRMVVVLMLALLHVAVLRGAGDGWARALLLAQLGLMLLWQPFVPGAQRVGLLQVGMIALVATAVMLWLDWWMLAFWVVVLAGLVGGRVFVHQARWQKRCYLIVLVYLLALLAVVILPEIAPRREISVEIHAAAAYGLPLLILATAVMPVESEVAEAPQVIDLFYSVFLMLMLGTVVLGSFTLMTLARLGYLEALARTLFLVAAAILAIGLAWSPRTGGGLNLFFSRYLFSIGLPVERWLSMLSELSQGEADPERFLAQGASALARLPWIAGASWRAGGRSAEMGSASSYPVVFRSQDLEVTLYSRYRIGPALQWHLQLLGKLLSEFHASKVREQKLREASYLRAVHETGARLTHEVKNLLQSLNALCSLAASEDSPQVLSLIRRQLPAISQRLTLTLDKLQRPGEGEAQRVPAHEWWQALTRQYQGRGVEFSSEDLTPHVTLPRALFDNVADNLLQNALAKRVGGARVGVRVTLYCAPAVTLRVCDSGSAVPEGLAGSLLRAPLHSATGLGIGLYQAARLAETLDYSLELASNRDGDVCFVLRPKA
jgi:signal transduction histidine kinase